tara:strand:- start:673 stop:882 length:210 start_codon:yes stop_codon:yes gene_type:complete
MEIGKIEWTVEEEGRVEFSGELLESDYFTRQMRLEVLAEVICAVRKLYDKEYEKYKEETMNVIPDEEII